MGVANLILLAASLILQGFLFFLIFRRRVFWQFPFFFAYTGYSVVATATLLAVSSHYSAYFIVFWINEAGLALFAVLALREVFRRVFLGFYAQFRWFRLLFPTVIGLIFVLVFWLLGYHRQAKIHPPIRMILLLGISVNFIQAGLFCLFTSIARSFHLRWRFAPLGIILGFAISGVGSAIAYWTRSEFVTKFAIVSNYASPVAYLLAIAVWLDTFLRPEPEPKWISTATMRQVAEEIRQDTMMLNKIVEKLK
ncbi:MAG: hypothetical protein LAO20_22520 [Acidobacteriia bacterium]|nr:hypothetical protein [Terriglobia bacterium]